MALLSVNSVEVVYDQVSLAVKGASLEVPQAGLVALLGANGAGKSTILKSISGLLAPNAAPSPAAPSPSRARISWRWTRRPGCAAASSTCWKAARCSSI